MPLLAFMKHQAARIAPTFWASLLVFVPLLFVYRPSFDAYEYSAAIVLTPFGVATWWPLAFTGLWNGGYW